MVTAFPVVVIVNWEQEVVIPTILVLVGSIFIGNFFSPISFQT